MEANLTETYRHLLFKRHWRLTESSAFLLGQCKAYVEAMIKTPILPKHHEQLLGVALIKGAQATTAIEGNTLSEKEIEDIVEGKKLPPSKEYQQIEVKNILEAFNELLQNVVGKNQVGVITPEYVKHLHLLVGKGLGEHLDAIPGRFRRDRRIVNRYRCPAPEDVEILIDRLCEWIKTEFHFDRGQSFEDVVIQAIVTHVYLEWIHPFGDGNGRTGRLIEFYILLRGGLPDIASHILSNHYNLTRSDYYRQLENAGRNADLTEFIQYALLGFRDGLKQTLEIIQQSQKEITWQKYVYDVFAAKPMKRKDTFKRQRDLMLQLPIEKIISLQDFAEERGKLVVKYGGFSLKTLKRDIEELKQMHLIDEIDGNYITATHFIKGSQARQREVCW